MPLIVKIDPKSKIQKVRPQVVQSIAARLHPETAGAGRGRDGRGSSVESGNIQQLLNNSPEMNLMELKNGDAIIVSSTVGTNSGRITAISPIADVELILTKPGTKTMSIGAWNLDASGGGQ